MGNNILQNPVLLPFIAGILVFFGTFYFSDALFEILSDAMIGGLIAGVFVAFFLYMIKPMIIGDD